MTSGGGAPPPPRLILLDAMGTLIRVREGLGPVYARALARHGVPTASPVVERALRATLAEADPWPTERPRHDEAVTPAERLWWRDVVAGTLRRTGRPLEGSRFERLFDELFETFARGDCWAVYGDVRPALTRWRREGIALGVASNFDGRLHGILAALGLRELFDEVTLPRDAGAAKPDPSFFHAAAARHGIAPSETWHVGDDPDDDLEGARRAGLRGVLVDRRRRSSTAAAVSDLRALR